jgi:hypothetical protein
LPNGGWVNRVRREMGLSGDAQRLVPVLSSQDPRRVASAFIGWAVPQEHDVAAVTARPTGNAFNRARPDCGEPMWVEEIANELRDYCDLREYAAALAATFNSR